MSTFVHIFSSSLHFQLSYRPPYAWDSVIHFLSNRAITGIELVENNVYQRLITYGETRGWIQAKLIQDNKIEFTVKLNKNANILELIARPKNILTADLSNSGLTSTKIETLKLLASAIEDKILILDGTECFDETCRKLLSIKGIGKWTVEYIAMRALKNPDAFPETDLELQKKISYLQLNSQNWIPWRAYAAVLLWNIKLST